MFKDLCFEKVFEFLNLIDCYNICLTTKDIFEKRKKILKKRLTDFKIYTVKRYGPGCFGQFQEVSDKENPLKLKKEYYDFAFFNFPKIFESGMVLKNQGLHKIGKFKKDSILQIYPEINLESSEIIHVERSYEICHKSELLYPNLPHFKPDGSGDYQIRSQGYIRFCQPNYVPSCIFEPSIITQS
jgi:hypothetical protein